LEKSDVELHDLLEAREDRLGVRDRVARRIERWSPTARLSDASANLPSPPAQLIDRLRKDDFVIASVDAAGGGVMGASRIAPRSGGT